ncbi:hypothetical protein OAX78_02125 [Planctomycetota bacterium]|nr:hypothetical protein [Planctomycetota bacterium]
MERFSRQLRRIGCQAHEIERVMRSAERVAAAGGNPVVAIGAHVAVGLPPAGLSAATAGGAQPQIHALRWLRTQVPDAERRAWWDTLLSRAVVAKNPGRAALGCRWAAERIGADVEFDPRPIAADVAALPSLEDLLAARDVFLDPAGYALVHRLVLRSLQCHPTLWSVSADLLEDGVQDAYEQLLTRQNRVVSLRERLADLGALQPGSDLTQRLWLVQRLHSLRPSLYVIDAAGTVLARRVPRIVRTMAFNAAINGLRRVLRLPSDTGALKLYPAPSKSTIRGIQRNADDADAFVEALPGLIDESRKLKNKYKDSFRAYVSGSTFAEIGQRLGKQPRTVEAWLRPSVSADGRRSPLVHWAAELAEVRPAPLPPDAHQLLLNKDEPPVVLRHILDYAHSGARR